MILRVRKLKATEAVRLLAGAFAEKGPARRKLKALTSGNFADPKGNYMYILIVFKCYI